MENLKKVQYFNLVNSINVNFEKVEDAINDLEEGTLTPQANVANIGTTTAITTVPGTFADTASIQTYLSGANVIPNIQTRLSNLETKVNAILVALRAAGLLTV